MSRWDEDGRGLRSIDAQGVKEIEDEEDGLLVFGRVLGVGSDGVGVCHDDICTGGIFLEMVVLAIEAEGDGVIGIKGLDERVSFGRCVRGVFMAIWDYQWDDASIIL